MTQNVLPEEKNIVKHWFSSIAGLIKHTDACTHRRCELPVPS